MKLPLGLDRIIVPESSDRGEMQTSFGLIAELPRQLPVASRGEWFQGMPLIPWLAAKTTKVRIGMSITDTPYRAPGVLAAELATIDHLAGGRLNVGVGAGWMPEEFAAASAAHIFPGGTSTCAASHRDVYGQARGTAPEPRRLPAGIVAIGWSQVEVQVLAGL
jgi:alkanesulfonate monooxygenase SsuD/methylene tetrahydromethanopterin reductase-like flavin-dependent oxidoreductase (luciferase family)